MIPSHRSMSHTNVNRSLEAKTSSARQAETSLRRISQDLAMELEKQRALQQQVASELKNMESHCCLAQE